MTSKEAFDNLHRCALCYKSSNHDEWINHCRKVRNIVEKDLQVLDILKKWVLVNETYDDLFPYEIKLRDGYVSNNSYLVFTKDDYEKVKEWLENETIL